MRTAGSRALGLVIALAACEQRAPASRGQPTVAPRPVALVGAGTVRSCTASYSCGMSHPGLGSWSRTTSVDFATCTKTVASESGPFDAPPPPPGQTSDASTSSSRSTPVPPPECARLQALVTSITADDARREMESAQMDSTACDLTVTCGTATLVSVQRQSPTGPGPVAKLIAALGK